MVAERHRLRTLQVRVPGHRRLGVLRGPLEDRARKRTEQLLRVDAGVRDIEPERRGDLVVPRAPGVDLPAHLAELRFDEGVHVLGGRIDGVEPGERLAHLHQLGVVENAGRVQALRVQQRALHVVRQELVVVGLQELPDLRRELRADASRPERHASSRGT